MTALNWRLAALALLLGSAIGGKAAWLWQANSYGKQLADQTADYGEQLASKDRQYPASATRRPMLLWLSSRCSRTRGAP